VSTTKIEGVNVLIICTRWIMGGGEGGEVGERWSIIFGLVKIFRVGSESSHSDKGGRLKDFSPSE
jgi:hypothetical protein